MSNLTLVCDDLVGNLTLNGELYADMSICTQLTRDHRFPGGTALGMDHRSRSVAHIRGNLPFRDYRKPQFIDERTKLAI